MKVNETDIGRKLSEVKLAKFTLCRQSLLALYGIWCVLGPDGMELSFPAAARIMLCSAVNSIDTTPVSCLLLSNTCTASRLYPNPLLPKASRLVVCKT